jgi:hypothetical protein
MQCDSSVWRCWTHPFGHHLICPSAVQPYNPAQLTASVPVLLLLLRSDWGLLLCPGS